MPRARHCSSQEVNSHVTASAPVIATADNSVYIDSADVAGRRGVSVNVGSMMPFPCRSAGSVDASATSMRTVDDHSVVGGRLPSWMYMCCY